MVLDKSCNLVHVVDDYKSLIWTERYNTYGDFELVVPGTYENYSKFSLDTYLFTSESQKLMIIEQLEWVEKYNESSEIKLTGRSLESILDRRVVAPVKSSGDPWFYYLRGFNDLGDNIIANLVSECFAMAKPNYPRHVGKLRWVKNPADLPAKVLLGRDGAEMKLPQRRFNTIAEEHSKPAGPGADLRLSQYSIDLSSTLEGSLYGIVTTILGYYGGGFAIELAQGNPFVWWGYVYKGVDRTRSQTKRSPVIFSPRMDNLSKATHIESVVDYRSVIYSGLVSSQSVGEAHEYGDTKPKTQLANSSKTIGVAGLERREGYLQNISINEMTGVRSDRNGDKYSVLGEQTMTKEQVLQKIEDACTDELYKHGKKTVYTGEADMTTMYRYGEDFFLGDLVQLENGHGLAETAVLTEYTRSSSEADGEKFYPTFTKPNESSAWHH